MFNVGKTVLSYSGNRSVASSSRMGDLEMAAREPREPRASTSSVSSEHPAGPVFWQPGFWYKVREEQQGDSKIRVLEVVDDPNEDQQEPLPSKPSCSSVITLEHDYSAKAVSAERVITLEHDYSAKAVSAERVITLEHDYSAKAVPAERVSTAVEEDPMESPSTAVPLVFPKLMEEDFLEVGAEVEIGDDPELLQDQIEAEPRPEATTERMEEPTEVARTQNVLSKPTEFVHVSGVANNVPELQQVGGVANNVPELQQVGGVANNVPELQQDQVEGGTRPEAAKERLEEPMEVGGVANNVPELQQHQMEGGTRPEAATDRLEEPMEPSRRRRGRPSKQMKKKVSKPKAVKVPEVDVIIPGFQKQPMTGFTTLRKKGDDAPSRVMIPTQDVQCRTEEFLEDDFIVFEDIISELDFNTSLFTTSAISNLVPSETIEIREQPKDVKKTSWQLKSVRKEDTLRKYAQYQSSMYQQEIGGASTSRETHIIKFGTNLDLPANVFEEQMKEVEKLPELLQHRGASTMLSRLPFDISGMNCVQMYLKVKGARTPGHQENNNFCSVNINLGPGTCVWWMVPNKQWKKLDALCKDKNLKFLSDSWWPNLNDLKKRGISYSVVTQKPGELIWLNIGTVHWVQANGVTNNIAWNVGPMTLNQYSAAFRRYEHNIKVGFQSIVPMHQLSWNLLDHPGVKQPQLIHHIWNFALKSFGEMWRTLKEAAVAGSILELSQATEESKTPQYCTTCESEVFNIVFLTTSNEVRCRKHGRQDLGKVIVMNHMLTLGSSIVFFWERWTETGLLPKRLQESEELKAIFHEMGENPIRFNNVS